LVVGSDLGQQWFSLIFTKNYLRFILKHPNKKKESCQKELNKECESIKSSSENKPLLIKPLTEEYL
jgi:hypothetical protein